jgi:hypothetical protein
MFTSTDLRSTITLIRPIVERQLDDADVIAGHREKVTAQGGDWSQVKALVKAMIQDERDEAGGHKRVMAILHKADNALGYADMLGLGNLNEKNSFADETGEITEPAHVAADSLGVRNNVAEPPRANTPVPDAEANQSMAALKEVHADGVRAEPGLTNDSGSARASQVQPSSFRTMGREPNPESGNQAPPVDTIPNAIPVRAHGVSIPHHGDVA